jgi:hypothetical protein
MYSTLSTIADRNFVIGFFIPALLGIIATLSVFGEGVPYLASMAKNVQSAKSLTDLTYFVVTVWTLGVLLSISNYLIYRILEGYTPPLAWCGFMRKWHIRCFRKQRHKAALLRREWAKALKSKTAFPAQRQRQLENLRRKLIITYPYIQREVKPTFFGNIIRAFELYPYQIYGADSIVIWPRIMMVMTKDIQEVVNGARAPVDCFVNVCMIANIFVAYGVISGIISLFLPHMLDWHRCALIAVVALVVSVCAYLCAVSMAKAWGSAVKSAFDCYLPELAKHLGYALPPDPEKRRAFWTALSQQVSFNLALDPSKWPQASNP